MTRESLPVLVVEDNPGDARLIREYLSEFGDGTFSVEIAETLADATRRTPGAPLEVVLVDLSLPDAQGLSVVDAARRRFPDAALVVLTGRNEASLAAAAVRAGAQDYIVKGESEGPALVRAVRDAVDRKRAAEIERLRAREALQKEFLANVSHEFRTPIAAIKGAVETLQDGGLDEATGKQFLDMIGRHAERLRRLVEDVLLVSSLEAQSREAELGPVALKPAVDKALSELAVMADKRKITFAMDVPSLRVKADAEKLDRVLESLCANAVEYNKPGGVVAVSAVESGGEVVVSVKDTGVGIAEKELNGLFDRFHRTARSSEQRAEGTGLGLMIVKRLLTAQGGRIWAESREGEGSVFRFALPRA